MKNSTDDGFLQHYNVQAADQGSRFFVGNLVSKCPDDREEAIPTAEAIPTKNGKPKAAALDSGCFSPTSITALEVQGIEPYIATGRDRHHQSWRERFAQQPAPPPEESSPNVKMAYRLQADIGMQIHALRKSTVVSLIGIIKETLGLGQFSVRGFLAVEGKRCLVCLAYNMKQLHVLVCG